jgi:ribosomal protein L40E
VLRSIKELEFDYAMGKVAKADFDEMYTRLRNRALGLMKQLDAGGGYKEQIAKEVEQRLARLEGDGFLGAEASAKAAGHRQDAATASTFAQGASADREAVALQTGVCDRCETVNDEDAKFCKNCGAKL